MVINPVIPTMFASKSIISGRWRQRERERGHEQLLRPLCEVVQGYKLLQNSQLSQITPDQFVPQTNPLCSLPNIVFPLKPPPVKPASIAQPFLLLAKTKALILSRT